MQIVIEMDELYYIGILEGISKQPDETVCTHALYEAVKKGTLLPKGHGRLIDKDKTKCSNCGKFGCENSDICSLYHAQTIIEADRGDAE